jgi:hypothetical protein
MSDVVKTTDYEEHQAQEWGRKFNLDVVEVSPQTIIDLKTETYVGPIVSYENFENQPVILPAWFRDAVDEYIDAQESDWSGSSC